jgi:hypothetical protein
MVSSGIAADEKDAWNKFKTLSEKPEETVVMDLYRANMQSTSYFGQPKKAMEDARAVAAQIKGSEGGNDDPLGFEGDDPLGLFGGGDQ